MRNAPPQLEFVDWRETLNAFPSAQAEGGTSFGSISTTIAVYAHEQQDSFAPFSPQSVRLARGDTTRAPQFTDCRGFLRFSIWETELDVARSLTRKPVTADRSQSRVHEGKNISELQSVRFRCRSAPKMPCTPNIDASSHFGVTLQISRYRLRILPFAVD